MKEEYFEFFDILPKHALVPLLQVVPHKFEEIDTNILAYIFTQHGVIKKKVSDNLKESADKVIKQQLKAPTKKKQSLDYKDMKLSKECEILIDSFLYFKNRYKDTVTSDIITTYVSYVMISDTRLKCYSFFQAHLYVREVQNVVAELKKTLNTFIGSTMSESLLEYGEYLTDPLIYKKYDCYSREKEIAESINTLCRMNKANVMLVGNTGVVKTSIVYGICNIIQSVKCPDKLKECNVFSLSINKIMSNTKYRGDLEARIDMIVSELRKYPDTILFIDEIHSLFGKDEDLVPVQNALKPFLSENSKMIGCTTSKEYKKIEKDKAFERRFSVINVEEMTEEDTLQTLLHKKDSYEDYHRVKIDDSIITKIISMCSVYIKNRYFPDKAFDILDRSCVCCIRDKRDEVIEQDVETAIYSFCNLNPNKVTIQSVSYIEDTIKNSIIGQDSAIKSACNCLRRYYIGTNDKTKPIGNLLFVGPTGTGKTELCKQLAKNFFTEESFIRFDMSEFMESHSVSKLIGSPPGYVGFNQGGTLTELVKHNPFSVILFDEIEKAHKDVVNILLQIMDDGRLTDSYGSVVNFCNCLIVMTSNLGCKEYLNRNTLGFSETTKRDTNIIKNEINNFFAPEFLNRLDDIIYFNTISEDMFNTIYNREITNFIERYDKNNIIIKLTYSANTHLKSICYSEKDGVRFVKNTIQRTLEQIIFDNIDSGNEFNIDFEDDRFKLAIEEEVLK